MGKGMILNPLDGKEGRIEQRERGELTSPK